MTKKELYHICHANGIPPLLYKWSFYEECHEGVLRKIFIPVFENIDKFIQERSVWYIYLDDTVLASRIGVTFFKAAILENYRNTRYTTIDNIALFQREHWYDNGDVYTNLLHADFLLIDKVKHKMEDFQKKIWDKFIEDRFLLNKSTVIVGLVNYNKPGLFNERAIDLFKTIDAKIVNDSGFIEIGSC